jgi:hypothetical protein
MSQLKVVIVFQGNSGIPKDEMENSFHFQTASGPGVEATQAEAATAASRISNFFDGAGAGGTPSIADYMSPMLLPTATYKVYDYFGGVVKPNGDVDTGPPMSVFTGGAVSPAASEGLPEEVALCLSYWTTSNTARHRGRVYLGPLGMNAATTGLAEVRPNPAFMATMSTAGSRLVEPGTAAQSTGGIAPVIPSTPVPASVDGVNWYLRSRVGSGSAGAPVPKWEAVTAGWVDNEWDSQRRRRIAATSRVTFP